MPRAKTIGIISIKGGVGKTTTVSNLGAIIANDFKKKVLVVDANFSAPNLGLHLGIVNPEKTIHDVLIGKHTIKDAIIEHELGFDVLPANLLNVKIDAFKLKHKLNEIKDNYDVIILDSSPNLNDEILATMIASDELFVVTTPDFPTLSTTMHAVKVAKQKKTPISGLILNNVRNKKFELTLNEIEDATGVPIVAMLPDDVKVVESLSQVTPAALFAPKSKAVIEYKKLAAAMIGENFNDGRFARKFTRFFNKGISKHEVNRDILRNNR